MSLDRGPFFKWNPDQTMSWKDQGCCIEASGDQNGDAALLNACTGAADQRWIWISRGHGRTIIQLENSNKCLDVSDKEGHLNGAPIVLQECENKASQSWRIDTAVVPTREPSGDLVESSTLRYGMVLMMSLVGMALLGMPILGSFIRAAYAMDASQDGSASTQKSGASFIVPAQASRARVQEVMSGQKQSAGAHDPTPMSRSELSDRAKHLTPLQRAVAISVGTENAFTGMTTNGYAHDNTSPGYYVGAVSGLPLFSSNEKYDSGTGWPSFFAPVDRGHVILRPLGNLDLSFLGRARIEVLDAESGAHLGHVFSDGPEPTGQRYCINAAALRFVPSKDGKVPRGSIEGWQSPKFTLQFQYRSETVSSSGEQAVPLDTIREDSTFVGTDTHAHGTTLDRALDTLVHGSSWPVARAVLDACARASELVVWENMSGVRLL